MRCDCLRVSQAANSTSNVHLRKAEMADKSHKQSVNVQGERQHRRLPNRLGRLARIVLTACVVIQSAAILPGIFRHLTGHDYELARTPSAKHADPTEEWQDDIFPLRDPTPWDISTDFPYSRTLSFSVDEGTWLRLDLHPSSGEIVFDMLGDLYCLPATSYLHSESGSTKAQPIMLGIPYDSDPHFSPDGSKLIFRSDAELGVENIWITNWTGCNDMNVRPSRDECVATNNMDLLEALSRISEEEEMLAQGYRETTERKRNRLRREGRTNGTLRAYIFYERADLLQLTE